VTEGRGGRYWAASWWTAGEGGRRGQVRVWDVRQGRCVGCFGPGSEALDVLSVALHPSAPLIASGLAGTPPSHTLHSPYPPNPCRCCSVARQDHVTARGASDMHVHDGHDDRLSLHVQVRDGRIHHPSVSSFARPLMSPCCLQMAECMSGICAGARAVHPLQLSPTTLDSAGASSTQPTGPAWYQRLSTAPSSSHPAIYLYLI
jgi:hypothetical protein